MARAAGEGGGGGTSIVPTYVGSTPKPYNPPSPAPAAPVQQPPAAAPAPVASSIPGSGVYLQQQAQAQKAFEQAQSDINYRRGQMYSAFGLLSNGQVDPYSQYGQYQQMLGANAGALHAAQNASAKRGLGKVGLGGRIMQALRQQQGANQFNFQQTLLNNIHGFDVEGQNAQNTLSNALLAAQQAQEEWDFNHNAFSPAAPAAPSAQNVAPSGPLKIAQPATHPNAKTALAQHLASQKTTRKAPARRRP